MIQIFDFRIINIVIKIVPNITKNVFDKIKKEKYICWHLTTFENYKKILRDKIIKVKENNKDLNKTERLYLFPCKDVFKNFYNKSAIRAMSFSLSNNRNANYNILLKIDLSQTNIDKVFIDPDAPGFNAIYTFEPISTQTITNAYKLEFPKNTLIIYNEI